MNIYCVGMLNVPSNVPSCFDDNKLMYLMVSLFPMSFRYLYIGRNSENWQKSKTEVSQRKKGIVVRNSEAGGTAKLEEQLSCHGSMQGTAELSWINARINVARIHSHEGSRAKRIHSHEGSRAKRLHSHEGSRAKRFHSHEECRANSLARRKSREENSLTRRKSREENSLARSKGSSEVQELSAWEEGTALKLWVEEQRWSCEKKEQRWSCE